jgi:hypothetical protein
MKLLNEFINWVNGIREVELLLEGKGHMDHPEDMVILGGIQGYTPLSTTLSTMERASTNPDSITIKFDGYPALVFGSDEDGKFQIMDKHMFNRGANRPKIYSPGQFAEYEATRGENARPELVKTVARIWPSLQASYRGPGWYMGDLMFSEPLKPEAGYYTFKPNPNGILYRVKVLSEFSRRYLQDKVAGIAVHRWLKPEAENTEDEVVWLSNTGNLKPSGDVSILPVSMPVKPEISINNELKRKADAARSSEDEIYSFIKGAPQAASGFANLFTVYLNDRIVSGNLNNLYSGFFSWVEQYLAKQLASGQKSQKMHDALLQYIKANDAIVKQLFRNWIDVYNYKMSIVDQLDAAAKNSPIKGYLDTGKESQEGFVYGGLKFIDRAGFSKQNLGAKRPTQVAEAKGEITETLVIYPGGFHPFHLGHAGVFNHLAKKFSDGVVYVAATDTTTKRPFSFADKKFLAGQSGVPGDRFIQVKSPYRAVEITGGYDPDSTALIFAVSEKDSDRFTFGPKKDGSPPYFIRYTGGQLEPMSKHAYIYIVPKIDFKVAGKTVDSASQIRAMYTDGSSELRDRIIRSLYPNSNAPDRIKGVLDSVLGDINEADNPNYFGGSSLSPISGTPADLMPGPSKEEVEQYHKEMRDLQRFMGHK